MQEAKEKNLYNAAPDQNVDINLLLQDLQLEEKFILMVGLVGLYGDGELNEVEIHQLRKVISQLDFNSGLLIHRDPYDEELCIDEKLLWAISLLRNDFVDVKILSDQEIFLLFEILTKSINEDIDNSQREEKYKYANELVKALEDIAKADGEISEKERKIINIFKKKSKHFASKLFIFNMVLIGVPILGGIAWLVIWIYIKIINGIWEDFIKGAF